MRYRLLLVHAGFATGLLMGANAQAQTDDLTSRAFVSAAMESCMPRSDQALIKAFNQCQLSFLALPPERQSSFFQAVDAQRKLLKDQSDANFCTEVRAMGRQHMTEIVASCRRIDKMIAGFAR